MTEPNKESVRIPLPSRPDKTPPSASTVKPDTVRIVLPSRTPVAPVRRVPPKLSLLAGSESSTEPTTISTRRPPVVPPESVTVSPLLQPLPKPPGPEISEESRRAITPLPAISELRPAGLTQAGPKNETARISVTPRPAPASQPLDRFDAIPQSFGWGLFGLATLIFLIQIWIYVVS